MANRHQRSRFLDIFRIAGDIAIGEKTDWQEYGPEKNKKLVMIYRVKRF